MQNPVSLELKACHCCGLIQQIPERRQTDSDDGRKLLCHRCDTVLPGSGDGARAAARTAAAAVAALVLFWPAILCPILQIEKLGHRHESGILSGIIDLLNHGNYLVGGIVLVFSIVFPLGKILLLLELSFLELLHRKHKTRTLRLMEHVGKWSMMDVLLLAFLVMLVKLGNLVEFQFGPAVFAFVGCVVMSMIASLSFDPHSIWEEK